jgi:hypothetical protein
LHELWVEEGVGHSFMLAGPMGDGARSMLSPDSVLTWTVEAPNYVAAMSALYEYLDWGEYYPVFPELDSVDYVTRGWDTSAANSALAATEPHDTEVTQADSMVSATASSMIEFEPGDAAPVETATVDESIRGPQQCGDGVGDTDG